MSITAKEATRISLGVYDSEFENLKDIYAVRYSDTLNKIYDFIIANANEGKMHCHYEQFFEKYNDGGYEYEKAINNYFVPVLEENGFKVDTNVGRCCPGVVFIMNIY